jgi:hypothetical protein
MNDQTKNHYFCAKSGQNLTNNFSAGGANRSHAWLAAGGAVRAGLLAVAGSAGRATLPGAAWCRAGLATVAGGADRARLAVLDQPRLRAHDQPGGGASPTAAEDGSGRRPPFAQSFFFSRSVARSGFHPLGSVIGCDTGRKSRRAIYTSTGKLTEYQT